jgi:hypothetical protein
VSSATHLWEAWRLSKTMGVRPSELYGVHDEVAAWCFDRAVVTFGLAVENDIDEAVRNAKSKQADAAANRALRKWLNPPGDTTGMFRDPAGGR